MRLFSIPFFVLALVAATQAGAAAIETITVTAQRTAVAPDEASMPVETLSHATIDQRQALTLDELLRGLPGISIARAGGLGALTELRVRGSEANHVLLLLDGVEMNDPATGSAINLAHLSLAGINRVELLNGPQSALWGSDAIAGVVYLDTTPAPGTQRHTVTASAGSDATHVVAADLAASEGSWHYSLAAQRLTTDGSNPARQGNEDDGYANTTLHLNTGYRAPDWSVQTIVRRTRATAEYDPAPFPDFIPVDGNLRQEIEQELGRIDLRLATRSAWQHRFTADYFASNNRAVDGGISTDSNDADKRKLSYQSDYAFEGDVLTQHVSLALEYEQEHFHQRGQATLFGNPNQDQHLNNRAVVGEWRGLLGDGAALSLSARHDDNSAFRDAGSYRASVRAALSAATTLFASYGTGRKNPTFTERFGFTPDTFIGNPDLEPEQSTGYAVTIAQRLGQLGEVRLTGFSDRLRDEIDGFVFDPTRGAFTAENSNSSSRRTGVELSARVHHGAVDAAIDYTYLRASEHNNGDTTDEIRRPQHTARLLLDVQPMTWLAIELGVTYTGARDDFDFAPFPARRVTLSDYVLLHLGARARPSEHLAVFARIENIGNAHYEDVYGYAAPGRTVQIGVTASL